MKCFQMSASQAAVDAKQLSKTWLRKDFGFNRDASWNSPRENRTTTPTAHDGKERGEKRKQDFAPSMAELERFAPRALTWAGA